MRIEIGINPNCSESVVRFRTDKLTGEQREQLFGALKSFVEEYAYETDVFKGKIFGIECITVDGDAPYNDYDNLMASLKDLKFMDKVKIEREEK